MHKQRIKLNESELHKLVKESVMSILKEYSSPIGGFSEYEGRDIDYNSIYEQAKDYLETHDDISSVRELIACLGFREETFSEEDFETLYDACEDAMIGL